MAQGDVMILDILLKTWLAFSATAFSHSIGDSIRQRKLNTQQTLIFPVAGISQQLSTAVQQKVHYHTCKTWSLNVKNVEMDSKYLHECKPTLQIEQFLCDAESIFLLWTFVSCTAVIDTAL